MTEFLLFIIVASVSITEPTQVRRYLYYYKTSYLLSLRTGKSNANLKVFNYRLHI